LPARWRATAQGCGFGDHSGCAIRGTVANRAVLHAAESVRLRILEEHGRGVLPDCYTGRCTCNFLGSLRRKIPESMMETAIYTRRTASWTGVLHDHGPGKRRGSAGHTHRNGIQSGGVCRRGRASGPSAIARIAQPTVSRTISSTAPVAVSSRSAGPPGLAITSDADARLLFATSKLPMPSVFR